MASDPYKAAMVQMLMNMAAASGGQVGVRGPTPPGQDQLPGMPGAVWNHPIEEGPNKITKTPTYREWWSPYGEDWWMHEQTRYRPDANIFVPGPNLTKYDDRYDWWIDKEMTEDEWVRNRKKQVGTGTLGGSSGAWGATSPEAATAAAEAWWAMRR